MEVEDLPNASWVDVGGGHRVLAMGAPPGASGPGSAFETLAAAGIRRVVYLLDPWALTSMYGSEEGLAGRYLDAGIQPHWVPTPDLGIPRDLKAMQAAVEFLLGEPSGTGAVHCRAGVGRTGLTLACLMVARGASADEAVESLRAQRWSSLQSSDQVEFLKQFQRACEAA